MTKTEIKKGLTKLGLRNGDIVILHSSLASLGHVKGGADTVVDAFLEVLGKKGTLVAPSFGNLGIIPDTIKKRRQAVKSIHPMASVTAIGRDAGKICADHWKAETAHADGTPYMRIAQMGGYVCLLGVDQDRNTTLHTVEEILRLPYLKTTAESTFETPEGRVTKSWKRFPGPHRNFIELDRLLREGGTMKMGRIGDSVVRLMKAQDMIDVCLKAGRKNPAFVLCDNPNCIGCVSQRSALKHARLPTRRRTACKPVSSIKKRFVLAASSGLAGRCAEEIIENLKTAGIDHVELDYLQGNPIHKVNKNTLRTAVEQLKLNGIRVTGMRLKVVPDDNMERTLTLAAANEIKRIVMPIDESAGKCIKAAGKAGVIVSMYNVCTSSKRTSEMLLEITKKNKDTGFTFNAANFARSGENPFMGSYKEKLRRYIDQLDIEDAAFDGNSTALARGNAEIKEMISILRCASFSGLFVLGYGNRAAGTLGDAANGFRYLLNTI